MRTFLAILLFVASTFAGDNRPGSLALAACGPENVRFNVKTNGGQRPDAPIEPGKALVYVVQEQVTPCFLCTPTTRVGLDGGWMGANRGNSYFFFSVTPGEHHLCASGSHHPATNHWFLSPT